MTTTTIFGAKIELPDPISYIDLPQLTGSEKQVAWANQIRESVMESLKKTVVSSTVTLSSCHPDAISSVESMIDCIRNDSGIAGMDEAWKVKIAQNMAFEFRALAARMTRYNQLMSITDSAKWIDARPQGSKNHNNSALGGYVRAANKEVK